MGKILSVTALRPLRSICSVGVGFDCLTLVPRFGRAKDREPVIIRRSDVESVELKEPWLFEDLPWRVAIKTNDGLTHEWRSGSEDALFVRHFLLGGAI